MSSPAVEAAQRAWVERYSNHLAVKVTDSANGGGLGVLAITAACEALKPLRELHKRQVIMCLAANCGAEVCDHEDECPADTPVTVCAECWQIVELASSYYGEEGIDRGLLWPCATARLIYTAEEITEAGGAE